MFQQICCVVRRFAVCVCVPHPPSVCIRVELLFGACIRVSVHVVALSIQFQLLHIYEWQKRISVIFLRFSALLHLYVDVASVGELLRFPHNARRAFEECDNRALAQTPTIRQTDRFSTKYSRFNPLGRFRSELNASERAGGVCVCVCWPTEITFECLSCVYRKVNT